MRDQRDPTDLGRMILSVLSENRARGPMAATEAHDIVETAIADDVLPIKPYNANPTPHEKYGDPRTLPSTLP